MTLSGSLREQSLLAGGAGGRLILRKKELANELGVSPRTIDNWVRQKRIPILRVSSRLVRFNVCKVLAALNKYEVREVGRKRD